MSILEINDIKELEIEPTGHYWDFPEYAWTFAHALAGSKLKVVSSSSAYVYIRSRGSQASIITWQGSHSEEAVKEIYEELRAGGYGRVSFNPVSQPLPVPGYTVPVWYTYASLLSSSDSRNRTWQLRRALKEFEYCPLEEKDLPEALARIRTWRIESERRHGNLETAKQLEGLPYDKDNKEFAWVQGYSHYVYSTKHHLELPNSRFFVGRDSSGRILNVLGGWIDPVNQRAACSVVKHDFTNKWSILSLWAKWTEFVHTELGYPQSDNGTTSDYIKKRLGMTRYLAYKPTRGALS